MIGFERALVKALNIKKGYSFKRIVFSNKALAAFRKAVLSKSLHSPRRTRLE